MRGCCGSGGSWRPISACSATRRPTTARCPRISTVCSPTLSAPRRPGCAGFRRWPAGMTKPARRWCGRNCSSRPGNSPASPASSLRYRSRTPTRWNCWRMPAMPTITWARRHATGPLAVQQTCCSPRPAWSRRFSPVRSPRIFRPVRCWCSAWAPRSPPPRRRWRRSPPPCRPICARRCWRWCMKGGGWTRPPRRSFRRRRNRRFRTMSRRRPGR